MAIVFRNTAGEQRRVKCSHEIYLERYLPYYNLGERKQLLEWLKLLRTLNKKDAVIWSHYHAVRKGDAPNRTKIIERINDNRDAVEFLYKEVLEEGARFLDRRPKTYRKTLISDWKTYQIVYAAIKKYSRSLCGNPLWAFQN